MKYLTHGSLVVLLSLVVGGGNNQPPSVQSNTKVPANWKKVDLEDFSFYVPAEMKPHEFKRGTDSSVWRYSSDNLDLTVDYGRYSAKPSIYEEEPGYREERVKIGNKKATMCFFRLGEPDRTGLTYAAAVYFQSVRTKASKLAFHVHCASPTDQEIARRIFLSIRFK